MNTDTTQHHHLSAGYAVLQAKVQRIVAAAIRGPRPWQQELELELELALALELPTSANWGHAGGLGVPSGTVVGGKDQNQGARKEHNQRTRLDFALAMTTNDGGRTTRRAVGKGRAETTGGGGRRKRQTQ